MREQKKSNTTERIHEIGKLRLSKNKYMSNMNKRIYAESINKYWCKWGKKNKPRDTIKELRIPLSLPPSFSTNSIEMAEIAANHYNMVQTRDLDLTDPATRNTLINKSLANTTKVPADAIPDLSKPLEYEDIKTAL